MHRLPEVFVVIFMVLDLVDISKPDRYSNFDSRNQIHTQTSAKQILVDGHAPTNECHAAIRRLSMCCPC